MSNISKHEKCWAGTSGISIQTNIYEKQTLSRWRKIRWMYKHPKMLLCFVLLSITMIMCSTDELINSEIDLRNQDRQDHVYDGNDDDLRQTVLGDVMNNPYTYKNMLAAYKSLCKEGEHHLNPIRVTDLHIKLKPQNYEQLKSLYQSPELIIFDYPQNRAVIEMGDFYIDPSVQNEIPEFYAIVDKDAEIPKDIPYEVIEEYAYLHTFPTVVAESFRLTGNFEFVNDYIFPEDFVDVHETEFCDDLGAIPIDDCPPGCELIFVINDADPNNISYEWKCDCSTDNGGGGSEGAGLTNDCGCPIYQDERKPAGCISVENNSSNRLEGLNDVKVIIKDFRFGKAYETSTDADGCWKYNKRFRGNMWMWVQFINEDSYERCYRNNLKVWELLRPVKDYVEKISGPRFNDIELNYWFWGNQGPGSQAQRYWGAATLNNEVKIFLEETQDLADPPKLLDIYLQPNTTSGAAIMGRFWPNAVVSALIPDLSIGIEFVNRERLDRLTYHELAHASHFSQVGFSWWDDLIVQEISNSITVDGLTFSFDGDPHGVGDEVNAGHVALAESWADNVSTDILSESQEGQLFENGYIPRGLYEDLVDDTPDELLRLMIFDRVNGFTRAQMFKGLNSQVTTVDQYQDFLLDDLPNDNTIQNFNRLFEAYTP